MKKPITRILLKSALNATLALLLLSFTAYNSLAQRQLLGLTYSGIGSFGTIFSYTPVVSTYNVEYGFGGVISDGYAPSGALVNAGGVFYGVTHYGGTDSAGTIFEWNPVTHIYTKKIDLDSANGYAPWGSMTYNGGKFYGMTNAGGINNAGVIFEWDPTTNIYTKKIDLSSAEGSHPYGSLSFYAGKFYGMTYLGGVNNAGVIFEWDPLSNIYTKKFDFDGLDGVNPYGSLTFDGVNFVGVTYLGGNPALGGGGGVVFEWDPINNIYYKKAEMDALTTGYGARCSLTKVGSKFYGTCDFGGAYYLGTLFEWDQATNTCTKKIDFDGTNGSYGGTENLLLSEGKLFGMTALGGYNGEGVMYEFNPVTNNFVKIIDLYNYPLFNGLVEYYGPDTHWYLDADNDKYYTGGPIIQAANPGTGYITDTLGMDCDDADPNAHSANQSWVLDADGDHYYIGELFQCYSPGAGYVMRTNGYVLGDCNDADASVHDGNTLWYLDADMDGYYIGSAVMSCNNPGAGYTSAIMIGGDDCDDADATVHDGNTTWYLDADIDGYYTGSPVTSCHSPGAGYTSVIPIFGGGDCDDNNAAINPGVVEILGNGIDDNCNGYIDEIYCIPVVSNPCTSLYINVLTIGSINNATACSPSGYADYSASLSTTQVPGDTVYFSYMGYGNTQFSVFIDYNNDGDFYDSDELVVDNVQVPNNAAAYGSFIIPLTITPGSYRMRVINDDISNTSVINPCSTTNGEAEDYAMIVTMPPWFQDLDGDNFGNPNVMYYSWTQPIGYVSDNTDCNDNSNTIYPGAPEIPNNGIDDNCNGYIDDFNCIPVVTQPCFYLWISNVTIGSINNNTACSPTGYGDYSATQSTAQAPGDNVSYSLTGYGNHSKGSIYVDFNNDGDFNDLNEQVVSNIFMLSNTVVSGTFSIPITVTTGSYRMRVVIDYYGFYADNDPCFTNYGEVEDYTLIINSGCTVPDVPTISASSTTNCGTQNTTLSIATGSLNNATNWQWYSGSCGGTLVGTGTSINVSPSDTTEYYVRGEGGCVTPGSCASITVNVNQELNWYIDADSDGYYSIIPLVSCSSPGAGYFTALLNGTDCDDNNPGVHPGATEICGNGIDDDCNGLVDENCCAITINGVISNVICKATNTGAIDVTTSNASGSPTYLWNNGSTSEDISALYARTYTVTVTYYSGCSLSTSFSVVAPASALTVSLSKTNLRCGGVCKGAIYVNSAGGTPPYSYSWSNGETGSSINNLCSLSYTITVTDAAGCSKVKSTTLTQNPALVALAVQSSTTEATVSVSGGVAPYTYLWRTNPIQYGVTATGLLTGHNYKVKVTDSKGCTMASIVNILALKLNGAEPQSQLSIYPNPTNGFITITGFDCKDCTLSIMLEDVTGRVIQQSNESAVNGIVEKDFGFLSIGIYFLRIDLNNRNEILRLVIK